MIPVPARPTDFWRVNSYGYPNPLMDDPKSQEAWTTLLSFYDYASYSDLKDYWASNRAPRRLSSNAVESWKATFEEFGLLYVLRGSDQIQITPAGVQYGAAGEDQDESQLAWIGLTLLMRYPLRGPRRPKSVAHAESNLLLYRFFYAAMHDLRGYFWATEIDRILCRVFLTEQASEAIEDVKNLRANPSDISKFPIPAAKRHGAFYNSLNQVVVHAGMNHMLLRRESDSTYYGDDEPKRRHLIAREWLPLVRDALNLIEEEHECGDSVSAIGRLPSAPDFASEESYFDYIGALVPERNNPAEHKAFPTISVGGDMVAILKEGEHFNHGETGVITGSVVVLCRLSVGQRLVLSSDQRWTYFVKAKQLITADTLSVQIRRGRPIIDHSVFSTILEGGDA